MALNFDQSLTLKEVQWRPSSHWKPRPLTSAARLQYAANRSEQGCGFSAHVTPVDAAYVASRLAGKEAGGGDRLEVKGQRGGAAHSAGPSPAHKVALQPSVLTFGQNGAERLRQGSRGPAASRAHSADHHQQGARSAGGRTACSRSTGSPYLQDQRPLHVVGNTHHVLTHHHHNHHNHLLTHGHHHNHLLTHEHQHSLHYQHHSNNHHSHSHSHQHHPQHQQGLEPAQPADEHHVHQQRRDLEQLRPARHQRGRNHQDAAAGAKRTRGNHGDVSPGRRHGDDGKASSSSPSASPRRRHAYDDDDDGNSLGRGGSDNERMGRCQPGAQTSFYKAALALMQAQRLAAQRTPLVQTSPTSSSSSSSRNSPQQLSQLHHRQRHQSDPHPHPRHRNHQHGQPKSILRSPLTGVMEGTLLCNQRQSDPPAAPTDLKIRSVAAPHKRYSALAGVPQTLRVTPRKKVTFGDAVFVTLQPDVDMTGRVLSHMV